MKKVTGLKNASGATKVLNGWNGHVQVNWNKETGKIWTEWETNDSWQTTYHDDDIVSVSYKHPATMKEIKKDLGIE